MTDIASLKRVWPEESEVSLGLVDRTSFELRAAEGHREWLVTNRRGTFASGSVDRELHRKYHSLLTVRDQEGASALNLAADVVERATVDDVDYAFLSIGRDAETTGKRPELQGFVCREHPIWTYELGSARLQRELILAADADVVMLRYELSGNATIELSLEPLLLFRKLHGLAKRDLFLNGKVQERGGRYVISPYIGMPALHFETRGATARFDVRGAFREVTHDWEEARGYEPSEYAFSPGRFTLKMVPGESVTVALGTTPMAGPNGTPSKGPPSGVRAAPLAALLERAAAAFLYEGRSGPVIIGGFPWFGESTRQTLLALPGLTATPDGSGRRREILERVGATFEKNLTAEPSPKTPVYLDALDVPLLFVRAVHELTRASPGAAPAALIRTAASVVSALTRGAHPRVRLADDGLLFISRGPWALTWMDAKVDGLPVTARSGYAVETSALYIDALAFLAEFDVGTARAGWAARLERARSAFMRRFWSAERGYLADCHDGGMADISLRPNQLWAAALPSSPLSRAERLSVIDVVHDRLLTDVGIRTLAPEDARYVGHAEADVQSRDMAAHQGSAWPWLLGLYADALSVVGEKERLREDLMPVLSRLERHVRTEDCLGQISECFDGDAPFEPRGAPAHAASVAEVSRVVRMVER
jgi:glycogen debranching enzyme